MEHSETFRADRSWVAEQKFHLIRKYLMFVYHRDIDPQEIKMI